jgi:hypothetical protein
MESVVWAITNVAKNVECSHPTNKANIPDLQSILSVAGRERTGRLREPQRVSAIVWETFRVYILRGVAHIVTSRGKSAIGPVLSGGIKDVFLETPVKSEKEKPLL